MPTSSSTELKMAEKLDLARRLYRQFYAQCFWYLRPDLEVNEDNLPIVIKGLRKHGGRRGFLLADKLCH